MKSNGLHNNPLEVTSNKGSRNLLNGMLWFVCTLALSILSAETGLAQSTMLVHTHVDGLPAGLSVGFVGRVTQCTQNGITFPLAGSVNLTEQSFTTIERVVMPGGQIVFRGVTHTSYVGELTVVLPANNGCGGAVPNNTFTFDHAVQAQNNGAPVFRFASGSAFITSSPFQINRTIEGKTTSLVENGIAPTTLDKGSFHRVNAQYLDSFGTSSISAPSLDITQSGITPFGMPTTFSFGRMFITDAGNMCLRVNGSTVCRALSQGGTLANGGITVDVGAAAVATNSTTKFVTWRFRLDATFPTGNFTLVAAADDADPDEYMVDGSPTPLNLLSWKAIKLVVDVVN